MSEGEEEVDGAGMDADQVAIILNSLAELRTAVEQLKNSTSESQKDVERLREKIETASIANHSENVSDTMDNTNCIGVNCTDANCTANHAPSSANGPGQHTMNPANQILANQDSTNVITNTNTSINALMLNMPSADTQGQPNTNQGALTKLYDLPTFSGNAEEWPLFAANFSDSTRNFGYNNIQNLMRLQKSLVGPAREAVASMLIHPQDVCKVMDELKFRFGRPDLLVRHQLNKLQHFPAIAENKIEQMILFSTRVRNVVAFLTSANCQQHLSNTSLLEQMVAKLPPSKQFEWVKHSMEIKPFPTIADFSSWLSQLARVVCLMPPQPTQQRAIVPPSQPQPRRVMQVTESQTKESPVNKPSKCFECNGAHLISNCDTFNNSLNVQSRWEKVKSHRLCFSCLRKGHNTVSCRSKVRCGIGGCQKYHHRKLHDELQQPSDVSPPDPEIETGDSAQSLLNCNLTPAASKGLLFKILPVTLFGPKGQIDVFAMIDEGSAISMLEEEAAKELGLKGRPQPLTLQWYRDQVTTEPSQSLNLEIRGCNQSSVFPLKNIRTIRNLNLPVQSFSKARFKHLEFIPLEDYNAVKPVMLLGIDNAYLGVASTTVQASEREPVAVKTKLGWIAYGPTSATELAPTPRILHLREPDELHELVVEYFAADNFGMTDSPLKLESEEDVRARQILEETTHRVDQRFETGLLWKAHPPKFPRSLEMAKKRLQGIEEKMRRDNDFSLQYKQEMTKYLDKGYARKLSTEEVEDKRQPVWYLPHFAVYSPHKPGKLRIVFDAAAEVDGCSLNSNLLKGPEQAKPLMSILFKFREGRIGVAADIREMFSQVRIRPQDQTAQRFLWRSGQEIEHYAMVSMIFGAICSPCSAEYIKNRNASEFAEQYPDAVDAIVNKHYVDDFVASFHDEQEALRICQEVKNINSKASFVLRHFVSNSDQIRRVMNEMEAADVDMVNMESQAQSEKILGMYWDSSKDCFIFQTKFHRIETEVLEGIRPPTKKELVGIVMAIFDPYGLLADFLLFLKVLVRDTWQSKLNWNDQLTGQMNATWRVWWNEFKKIDMFRVPRCYSTRLHGAFQIQLHIFVDASQTAFAAAGYFRIVHTEGVDVVFVCGKTRGAPQKTTSIPRLELQAGVLGTRLSKLILRNHDVKISDVVFWTDSRTLLCWINSKHRKFKAFVSHRIAEILSSSQSSQWRWVPTDSNSADAATRVKGPPKLKKNNRWLSGPQFLQSPENCWPASAFSPSPEPLDEEIVPIPPLEAVPSLLLQLETGNILIDFNRFSSYKILRASVAYTLRAAQGFKALLKLTSKPRGRFLTARELIEAERLLVQMVQQNQFDKEIALLKSSKLIPESSPIYSLSPYLDENGLLRVQGRIDKANYLPLDARRPILMPQKHLVSKLIMRHFHERCHHQNTAVTLNEARQRFWFPHARAILKSVQASCQVCKIDKARSMQPLMGQLPSDRLTPYVRPFSYTGVDLFGPFNVAIGRRREKRWAVIFTCLTVRACHLELAENLSTDAFLICLRNFVNRRGIPVRIRSDNGTNFIGAQKELKPENRILDVNLIQKEAASHYIEWIFNCPLNPSSGGAWERLIGIVKRLLLKTLREEAPRVETLRSVLIEAENIVNSRPLTDLPLQAEDDEPITPNHFLLGCVNSTQTPAPAENRICLQKQWRIAQNIKDRLWKRWMTEYLPQLIRRPKWHANVRPIAVDDLVLVCDPQQPRSQWRKGRVTEVFPAQDGQVRFAEVKTTSGSVRRPASRLAVLSVGSESRSDSRGEECC